MPVKVGELIADRYELEQLVGEGGMSRVYRAHDTVLERPVAIKVLHEQFGGDPEHVERFRREARAIARLAHPNVVTVIDRGEWRGRQFIVFEHVDGENLKSLLAREGRLPVGRALVLTEQIARALAVAHALGIVHRDVKPQNVLVDRSGTAKVTDFGIARSVDLDDELTETGTVLGTGHYISPEQANGERADERSDQYSLGVVGYELLTGEVPYKGENLMAVASRHVRDPVPSVRARRPDVPARVDAVLTRAMAKRPADRYPSMAALAAALESCLAGVDAEPEADAEATGVITGPSHPSPSATVAATGPLERRSRLRRLGIVALGAAVVVGSLVVLQFVLEDGLPGLGGGGDPISVEVSAVADFDPLGDGTEHPESVELATDGDPTSFWESETYRSFEKDGVGIVLDTNARVALSRIVVVTDTPGARAMILAGARRTGPFEDVSRSEELRRRTTFELDTRGREARYYLVWITDPGPERVAHLNEVRAFRSD
jgi:eukaryotic-like serine/threonine-protein kinase